MFLPIRFLNALTLYFLSACAYYFLKLPVDLARLLEPTTIYSRLLQPYSKVYSGAIVTPSLYHHDGTCHPFFRPTRPQLFITPSHPPFILMTYRVWSSEDLGLCLQPTHIRHAWHPLLPSSIFFFIHCPSC